MTETVRPDFGAITARQQATWSAGDFSEVGRQVIPVSEALVEAVDPHAGQRVLDVACGAGNAALAAARRYCDVSGIDYVPSLIERAQERAAAERTPVDFRVADAQALPYADATFDAVLSVFGVMFAPDQEKAAAELLRVTKPGGKIGLACWMPEGMVFEFFGENSKRVPPPPGTKPGHRWGTEEGLRELYGDGIAKLETQKRTVHMYFKSADHAVDMFRRYFGPTVRAFEMAGTDGAEAFAQDLRRVYEKWNRATDGTGKFEAVYLQSIATRA
jgi:ubiquinone/menaquinone biosynthesis C-methylase UbiE